MKKIFNSIVSKFTRTPEIIDWAINVNTVQRYGAYDVLVTDGGNRSYTLGIGAVLCGAQPVPYGKWQDILNDIQVGTNLKVRIRSSDLNENERAQVIGVLSLTGMSFSGR